jgi:hypothetical protein
MTPRVSITSVPLSSTYEEAVDRNKKENQDKIEQKRTSNGSRAHMFS